MPKNDALPVSFNTSQFYEILDYEFKRAERDKNAVTLMFIKLGQLEEIERNYGQLTAARVLKEIERLISGNIRRADRGFIYGNDEFMIILPNTPKNGASCMVPKLQRLIESHAITNESGEPVTLSPKFGIASFPHDGEQGTAYRGQRTVDSVQGKLNRIVEQRTV
jgi:diguanylate cyclase (GGDEF)-like protein